MELATGVPVEQEMQVVSLATALPASQPVPLPVPESSVAPSAAPGPALPALKTCRNCGEKKARSDFHRNHSKADELEDVCKPCKAQRDAARRAIRASVVPNVSQKTCKKCQVEKPAEEFPRNKLTSDGLHSYCKKCKLSLDTISREKRKRQDAGAYAPRGSSVGAEQMQQQQVLQVQQAGDGGAIAVGGPEQMPLPDSLLCNSCKQYHPIGSFAEDPAMQGVVRCADCRRALAAYNEQAQQMQQQQGQQMQEHLGAAAGVQGAEAQEYAAMAASSTPFAMHPGLAEAYQLRAPEAGTFEGMQMQQAVPSASAGEPSAPIGAPQSAHPVVIDAEGSLTALLVDPSLSEPLQVVAQKVCHGCALEKEAAAFMPDRRSKDGLMNYCRDCCLAGAPAAALPAARRPGRPPRSAAVIPLTHKACRKCQEEKPAEEFPQKKSHPDGRDDYCKACHARATAARVAARGPVKEPTVESKQCSKCHEHKPAAEFHRDCNKPDGLRGRCRGCEAVAGQARRQARHKTLEPTVESKVCRRCGIEKSADDFPRKKERSDGLDSYCKTCNCAATAQRVQRKGPMTPTVASKVCGRCGEEKPAAEFPARKFSTSDGLHSYCRSCKGTAASRPGGGPPPSAQADKQDMDAAASAAMQRAEAAAAVEASLASAASGAAIVPPESLPQQVAGWPAGLDAEQAASMGLQWAHMLAPQMAVPPGVQPPPVAVEHQQLLHLQQLHQQQAVALFQHMQPGQQPPPQQLVIQSPIVQQQVPPEAQPQPPEQQMLPGTQMQASQPQA